MPLSGLTGLHKNVYDGPGPGSYEIKGSFGHHHGAHYSFRLKPRDRTYRATTPGPVYNTNVSSFKNGAKYSFAGKAPPMKSVDFVPGPGRYNVLQKRPGTARPAAKCSFGGRPRMRTRPEDNTPGPGAYSLHNSFSKTQETRGPSFSMRAKSRELRMKESVPGAGAYTPRHPAHPKAAAYSFAGKYAPKGLSKISSINPGPGHYDANIAQTHSKAPAISLGKRFPQHSTTFANTALAKEFQMKQDEVANADTRHADPVPN